MEEICKNYGFRHISEKIFKCLDKMDLTNCRLVNKSFKKILATSAFWFNKLDSEVPDLVTRSWKSCCQTYKAWKMLSQEIEKIDTRLEEFVLLLIKMYKSQQIEKNHPLDIAAKLEKARKYPDLASFIRRHADPHSLVADQMKKHFSKIVVKFHDGDKPLGFYITDKGGSGIFISRILTGHYGR